MTCWPECGILRGALTLIRGKTITLSEGDSKSSCLVWWISVKRMVLESIQKHIDIERKETKASQINVETFDCRLELPSIFEGVSKFLQLYSLWTRLC